MEGSILDARSEPAGTATARLAEFASGLRYEQLAPATRRAFGRACLDYFTSAVTGSAQPTTRALLAFVLASEGSGACTVIGRSERLSASQAAFVNGAAAHGLDFDDGHTHGSAHPGSVIFSAALAVAEQQGSTPDELVASVVVGYDVMLRICSAIHPRSARRGWHNTAVAGVFGATAAAGVLLRLDASRMLHALGLAGSFAGGLRAFLAEGADIKRLHPGKAARDGVVCAGLAAAGITGPAEILEGKLGFFTAFVDGAGDRGALLDGLGERFLIEEVYFKPYPCCRHFHGALDAVLALRSELRIGVADVERMEIGLYGPGAHGHDHKHADNLLDAQMSAAVTAAVALRDGKLSLASYDPAGLMAPDLRRLIDATETVVDAECDRLYPARRSARVTLTLRDGRRAEMRVLDPRGEGENPLSDAELETKFIANAGDVLGAQRAGELLALVRGWPDLPTLPPLFAALRRP